MLGVSLIPHVRTPAHLCPPGLDHVTHAPFSAFPKNLSSTFRDTDGYQCRVLREHSITHLNVDALQMSPFSRQTKVRIRKCKISIGDYTINVYMCTFVSDTGNDLFLFVCLFMCDVFF